MKPLIDEIPEIPGMWLRCQSCGWEFHTPRWRSHCYPCGGDDQPEFAPGIFIGLMIILVISLVARFIFD